MRNTWLLSLCNLFFFFLSKKETDWLSYPNLFIYNWFIARDLVCDFLFYFVFLIFFFFFLHWFTHYCFVVVVVVVVVYTTFFFKFCLSVFRPFSLRSRFFGELKMILWLFCVCACVLGLNPTHFPASVCRYVTSLTCDMTLDDQPYETWEEKKKKKKKWGCHCLIVNNLITSAPFGHLSPRPFSLTH